MALDERNAAAVGNGREAGATAVGTGFEWVAVVAGVVAACVGASVLAGWSIGVPLLASWRANGATMWPPAAAALTLLGIALIVLSRNRESRAGTWYVRVVAIAVAALSAALVTEYAFGPRVGIGSILFLTEVDAGPPTSRGGWPAPVTAAILLFATAAIFFHTTKVPQRAAISHLLAFAVALGALHALIFRMYDPADLPAWAAPIPAAIGYLALSVGVVFLPPGHGFTRTFTADDLGGRLARRLLPAAVLLPFILGLLFVIGVSADVVDQDNGLTFVIMVIIVAFVLLVWRNAAVIHASEARRIAVESDLEAALAAARSERSYLRSVLDHMPEAIVIADAFTGRLVIGNRHFQELVGVPLSEMAPIIGHHATPAFHPDGRQYTARELPLSRCILHGESVDGEELEIDVGDGVRRIIRASARPIFSEDGAIIGGVAILVDITVERQEARERAEVAERLRLALSAGRMGTWEWDIASDRVHWSSELEAIHGAAGGEVPKTFDAYRETVHPADQERVTAAVHDALIGRTPYHTTYRVRDVDGAERRFEAWGRVFRSPAGAPERMVGICWDITEREAARESEARLATIVASSDDAIIGKDLDGTITSWNRGAERMYGYTAEEMIGRSISTLEPPGRESEFASFMERVARGQAVEHVRTERRTKDGRFLPVSITVSPIRDAENRVVGTASIERDETERIQAELDRERLLARERDLRQRVTDILETMADGFMALDRDYRLAYMNPAAVALVRAFLGRDPKVMLGRVLWECAPILLGTRFEQALRRTMEERVSVQAEDYLDDLDAWFEVRIAPTQDGIATFVRDVTERHRAEQEREELLTRETEARAEAERRREELQQVLESRERMMRGFSHDVKNPLGAADGQLYLLEAGIPDVLDARPHERVVRARQSIRAALRVIESLVELARAESAHFQFAFSPTDLGEVARDVAEEYLGVCAAKGLSMEVDIAVDVPEIETDVERVRQVLGNLVSNAVKYTDSGEVRVRVAASGPDEAPWPGQWVRIDVTDTGPGIPAGQQREVFAEFSRLSAHGERGAGLGLAIAQRLAQLLGGDITLESDPGRGSTFTLWIPASPPGGPGEPARDERTDAHATR